MVRLQLDVVGFGMAVGTGWLDGTWEWLALIVPRKR